MTPILLLALIQVPQPIKVKPIYLRPINDSLTLEVTAGENDLAGDAHRSEFRVGLLKGGKPHKLIGVVTDRGWFEYRVLRVDDSSLVVGRIATYSSEATAKLFLHPQKNYVIKQIDYPPDVGLLAVDDREVARVLDLPPDIVKQLEKEESDAPVAEPDSFRLPQALRDNPLPKSSYQEFARARPDRVKDGYSEEGTAIDESPGPYQVVGSRIWFGKTFYDGEGTTGVGGLGYFDTSTSQYTFMPIPMMADWSTSAILVENEAVWAGLAGYPEGEAYGGGLIRYDLKRGRSRKFPTVEVLSRIFRYQDRLYLRTKNGVYQLRGDTLTRYWVEPNVNHRFIMVSETVKPGKTKK